MSANIRVYLCSFVALCATAVFAAEPPAVHVRNFARVDAHVLRGGAPSETGLEDLRALHVSVDLDLREPGKSGALERTEAKRLGIRYVNISMRPFSAPTPGEMKQALALLFAADAGPGRIFVHCRRGKDRTGTVIACYRIERDGWSNWRALLEAKRHGMSIVERGMRSYIAHFHPIAISARL
ncbi:MAG: fused DSP-PTPase phosphatase/NAD kinase-like protein [Bryobacteraceae bacterium]